MGKEGGRREEKSQGEKRGEREGKRREKIWQHVNKSSYRQRCVTITVATSFLY